MIYFAVSAAKKVGMSIRNFRKLSKEIGKEASTVGSHQRILYSDADLETIIALNALPKKQGRPRGPYL